MAQFDIHLNDDTATCTRFPYLLDIQWICYPICLLGSSSRPVSDSVARPSLCRR